MKQAIAVLVPFLALTSCATMLSQHRMKAADRKLLATRDLQAQGDWAGALMMAQAMHSSVSKAVADKPVRITASGASVDLRPLLVSWEKGVWKEMHEALKHKSVGNFAEAFAGMKQQCSTCHLSLGRTDIKIAE